MGGGGILGLYMLPAAFFVHFLLPLSSITDLFRKICETRREQIYCCGKSTCGCINQLQQRGEGACARQPVENAQLEAGRDLFFLFFF